MKFYKISEILKSKEIKSNNNLNNRRRTYYHLYNDYNLRNNRKETTKTNQLYDESELYSFSPLTNRSGYITFSPNNFTPYTSRYSSYKKINPINQKRMSFMEPYSNGRNTLTNNNLFHKQNYHNFYDNMNNNTDIIPKYQNDYLNNNKNNIKYDLKRDYFNNTDYRFYSPINRPKKKTITHSNRNEDINSQISEYLNNFENNKKRMNLLYHNNKYDDYNPNKRDKSYNIGQGNRYNIKGKGKPSSIHNNKISYEMNTERKTELDNFFNKRNNKQKYNNNLIFNKDNFSFNKNQNNNKPIKTTNNNEQNNKDRNNKKLYNKSKEFFYSFNQKNNVRNSNKDLSKKNSNESLNPSSLGNDYIKTYYTNKQKTSNNNLNVGNSNINSVSPRPLDTQYHFLNGLKMTSGEVNEYFYDFNSKRGIKNDDQKSIQSLQSLSDSKMLELANHYLSEDDNSVENYQMNNIIYNKKKYIMK